LGEEAAGGGRHACGGRVGPEQVGDLAGGVGALLGVLFQHAVDEIGEPGGDQATAALGQRGHGGVHVHVQHLDGGLAGKGELAADEAVQDHAQGVEVAGRVYRLAGDLLGGHVAGGAHDGAGGGQRRAVGGAVREAGDAEVQHFDLVLATVALKEHHVVGLEVAVDDAFAVGGPQGLGDLGADVGDALGRHGAVLGEGLCEGSALEQLHGQVEGAVFGLAEVVETNGVWVLDARGGLHFALKAQDHLFAGRQVSAYDLEGDVAREALLLGTVDGAEAALPQACVDVVAAREEPADHGIR